MYPRRSREGLGGGSLGLMAYRDPKGERDKRMPEKRRSSPGVRGGASRDPRDMAKAGLPDIPIPRRRKGQSAGKTPETGAMLCGGIVEGSPQPPERGALPSEGNQGDEWDAYVVLGRMTGTNAGSPAGREPQGDGVPIVVVAAPRGAIRKEMKDIKHLVRAGWNAGPGLMQRARRTAPASPRRRPSNPTDGHRISPWVAIGSPTTSVLS